MEEEDMKFNPWEVESLEDFLYFCCPECNEKSQSKDHFISHAWSTHPKVSFFTSYSIVNGDLVAHFLYRR